MQYLEPFRGGAWGFGGLTAKPPILAGIDPRKSLKDLFFGLVHPFQAQGDTLKGAPNATGRYKYLIKSIL